MRARRASAAAAALGAAALAVIVVQTAAAGPATPPAATPPSKSLEVSAVAVHGLAPGVARQVLVRVSNTKNNTGSVTITAIDVAAGTPTRTVDGRSVSVPACRIGSDVVVTGWSAPPAGPAVTLGRNDSVQLPVTVSMVNRPANQDACKGVSIPLTFTATARGK